MTLFVGGPYDGRHLPLNPRTREMVRLPRENRIDRVINDPEATAEQDWTYRYKADLTTDPPCYRYIGPTKPEE